MNGTLLVLQAEDIEAVRRFVADDPYVHEGVYKSSRCGPGPGAWARPKEDP